MKVLRDWLLFVLLAFLCSWVRVDAATVAPGPLYGVVGWTPNIYAGPGAACSAAWAANVAANPGYSLVGSGTDVGGASCHFVGDVYINGSWAGHVDSSFNYSTSSGACPSGFVLRSDTGQCSNVNDTAGTGGGCKAGQDQRMQTPVDARGNAPYEVEYGGCTYRLAEARSCTVNGIDKACGIWTSTGDPTSAGTGAVAGTGSTADVVSGSGCTSSQIVNVTTGATTCLDSAETKPAYVSTGGVDASGNQVQVSQKCVGSACMQQTTTTPSGGGSPTTTAGPVGAGAGAGMAAAPSITFPSDYAKDATVSSLANNVQQVHTDITSTSATAPSDPVVKSTDDVSGQLLDSSFSSLKAWSLPARSVSCPTASFTLWGKSYTIDAHCTLWSTVSSQVQAVALVSWALLAMFIVLGA